MKHTRIINAICKGLLRSSFLPIIIVVVLTAFQTARGQTDLPAQLKDNNRGARYCEILVVRGSMLDLNATVYNTLGKNDCPPDIWNAIDFGKLKTDLNAMAVIKNGPRYFLMDKIGQTNASPPSTTFQGLELVERATVPVSKKKNPYEETSVKRSTYYVFNKGSVTYQLSNGENTYIMQSYSQIIDPNLQEKDLAGLAQRLKLPKGWTYRVVKLERDLVLKTVDTSEAFVVQDDLGNTYQKIR